MDQMSDDNLFKAMACHIAFKDGNGYKFDPKVWNKKRDDGFAAMIALDGKTCRRMKRLIEDYDTFFIPGPLMSFYNPKTQRIIWIADKVYFID
jgi:hypothetical protein